MFSRSIHHKYEGDWIGQQDTLEMPIAWKTSTGKLILWSGRHRVGYCIANDLDLDLFVIPYPKQGEELYSKRIK